jgi:hypothetical protein
MLYDSNMIEFAFTVLLIVFCAIVLLSSLPNSTLSPVPATKTLKVTTSSVVIVRSTNEVGGAMQVASAGLVSQRVSVRSGRSSVFLLRRRY